MVLGLRTKTRKSPSVQLDYIIHIQEIKPWPPSQSLRNLRAVLIQWEHGDKTSGLTNQIVPSLGNGTGIGDGRIEFNESFRLAFTLSQEMSIKGGEGDTFQKNCIEFNLYEPRRDKTVKGQQLGTAVLDLAEYGVVRENLSISVPINCKRTYRNASQPLLYLKIQPVERTRSSLMREASMDRNHGESVSALMSEEYAEEAEVASLSTDDDISTNSSLTVTSSPQNKENETVVVKVRSGEAKANHVHEQFVAKLNEENSARSSSPSSSIDLSSDIAWLSKRITSLQSSAEKQQISNIKSNRREKEAENIQESAVNGERDVKVKVSAEEGKINSPIDKETVAELDYKREKHLEFHFNLFPDKKNYGIYEKSSITTDDETRENYEEKMLGDFSQVDDQKQVKLVNGPLSSNKQSFTVHTSFSDIDGSKHGKSVRSSLDSSRSINGSTRRNHSFVSDTSRGPISSERKEAKGNVKETRSVVSDSRVQLLENRIKMLEGELREAAAMEVSLYSVVAEHGSSITKVHAPARRLSRLYFHAKKQNSKSRRGTAAKSVVSGLVLVAKACGNDVPRLNFWLSNCIVLRVIVSKSSGDIQLPISVGPNNGKFSESGKKKSSPIKWEQFTSKSTRVAIEDSVGDMENPLNFTAALEKVEAWIFSRIIESLWWQTFTPHMQAGAAKAIRRSMDSETRKLYRRKSSSNDHQQGNFSLELWKKAFRDACERICPVRAEGHDCGCLPLLSKLIMEQLISRLDVAMFNAILRESADEIPTDPVADPISDADVLPIPAGKASFGAGAQLKNAIGNWSRWLTDLFGIDDGDDGSLENEYISISHDMSSKSFHLLNTLSDLMMLPKDMLLSQTIRKEVCPTLGPPLIRRVLNSFVPDEFCPDPIPGVVLEALNSEDPFDYEEDSITSFPCPSTPIVYQTPSAASVGTVLGETSNHSKLTRSRSSLLKKSQTSDNELDELDSPLKAIVLKGSQSSPSSVRPVLLSKENGNRNTTVRYQLLREVWMNSE